MKTRMRVLAGAVLLGAMVSAYAAPVWQEGSTYTAGTVVSYNGQDYSALVTHTAYIGTGWNPAASPTLWKAAGTSISPTPLPTPLPTPTRTGTPTPTPEPTKYLCPIVTAPPGWIFTGYDSNGCAMFEIKPPTPTPTTAPTQAPASPSWEKGIAYTGGQRVSYNGQLYEAKWWTQGDVPGSSEWGPWKLLGAAITPTPTTVPPTPGPSITPTPVADLACKRSTPSWSATVSFSSGSKVLYGSGQYTALTNSLNKDPALNKSDWKYDGYCLTYINDVTPVVSPTPTASPTPTTVITPTPVITPTANPSSVPSYTPGTIPSKAQADALEVELTKDAPAYVKLVKETQRVIDDSIVDQVAPLAATNPDNVKRVERIVPAARFDYLFAIRNAKYSYSNFLKAVAKFPAFCQTYSDGRNSDAICSKLLATMFAHMVQETGANTTWLDGIGAIDTPKWRQGLYWVEEVAYQNNPNLSGYTDSCGDPYWGKIWTCPKRADGQYNSYHGRGAHQLTHHYNYAPFSKVLYGDPNVLLQDPKRVADTWLNLASSVFFMLETQPPKPAMIHVIDGSWVPNAVDQANGLTASFGTTINIINGGFECSKGAETSQAQNRIYAYQNFAQELGVPVAANEQLGCASQKQFSEGGAASFPLYWDKDWGWQRDYMCKPVNYQTGFRTISKGDYAKCVEFIWNVQVK
ncbi:carbohydrate-binding protein [Chitinilyticum aquatile]|uniref:carbohydrate-binding protein n=1 Tax=Chitinilyticum aquatile TaxID=362520 RepID=UPI000420B3B3|nr:carbohydrate-binding protein [Chitinilyticum aquatile]